MIKMDEPTQYLKDNFASIVGLLIYSSISCRPDLTTIVNKALLRKLGVNVTVTRRCQQEELSLKRESVGTPSTQRRQNWNKGD